MPFTLFCSLQLIKAKICFRELVDKKPNPESFLLLGDAYMSIQEVKKLYFNYYYTAWIVSDIYC